MATAIAQPGWATHETDTLQKWAETARRMRYNYTMSRDGGKIVSLALLTIVGPLCSTREDGEKVNHVVAGLLNQGFSVKLDFHGVKLVTPSFYSAAVADLYCTFPDDIVSNRLTMMNMPAIELFTRRST